MINKRSAEYRTSIVLVTLLTFAPLLCGCTHAQELPPPPPLNVPPPAIESQPVAPVIFPGPLTNLIFDAELKEYHAKPGDQEAKFTFQITNASDVAVHILAVNA